MGGGIGSNLNSGAGEPSLVGTITAVYNSNNDNYSGGAMNAKTCNGITFSSFDARPPSTAQANIIVSSWTNCKLYQGDGVNPETSAGVFWGRSSNSLVLTYSGWKK